MNEDASVPRLVSCFTTTSVREMEPDSHKNRFDSSEVIDMSYSSSASSYSDSSSSFYTEASHNNNNRSGSRTSDGGRGSSANGRSITLEMTASDSDEALTYIVESETLSEMELETRGEVCEEEVEVKVEEESDASRDADEGRRCHGGRESATVHEISTGGRVTLTERHTNMWMNGTSDKDKSVKMKKREASPFERAEAAVRLVRSANDTKPADSQAHGNSGDNKSSTNNNTKCTGDQTSEQVKRWYEVDIERKAEEMRIAAVSACLQPFARELLLSLAALAESEARQDGELNRATVSLAAAVEIMNILLEQHRCLHRATPRFVKEVMKKGGQGVDTNGDRVHYCELVSCVLMTQ